MTSMNTLKSELDDYDILCLQEPYMLYDGKLGGIPKDVVAFYSRTWYRTAAIFVNKSIPVMEIMPASYLVAVSIDLCNQIKVVMIFIYLSPIAEVHAELDFLLDFRDK